ncbi:DUF2459 domain-containing protein [Novosphingobium marinum]|uniref:Uncharacterized protein (TIGR02117 family) n=1 Tax=Novosphingobium marinum TaxID=1514948 RepID=A0A7Z0BTB2_9SPHN|nr:DUF2459 domain-containing protein [Novosphingobium marinum]NYH93903.1 uncharacterized protein (TIGR02117 family) [Novosphingobium marinum]
MVARLVRIARAVLGWLALAAGAWMLSIWIGSSIPRNPAWTEPADGVEIMVETNGVHTSIVMPKVTPVKDWRDDLPVSDIAASRRPYTHVSVSWGEREVFLNTPTWGDLSPLTVLRIAGIGGEGLLHVSHYVRPAPAGDIRPVRLTAAQYARLVRRIEGYLPPREARRSHPGYGDWDVFYETGGTYTFTNTCNQWTSDTLAHAGMRIGWWTPLAGGVTKWVERP